GAAPNRTKPLARVNPRPVASPAMIMRARFSGSSPFPAAETAATDGDEAPSGRASAPVGDSAPAPFAEDRAGVGPGAPLRTGRYSVKVLPLSGLLDARI